MVSGRYRDERELPPPPPSTGSGEKQRSTGIAGSRANLDWVSVPDLGNPRTWRRISDQLTRLKMLVSVMSIFGLSLIAWRLDAHTSARGLASVGLPDRLHALVYERDLFDISLTVVAIQIAITCIQTAWLSGWFGSRAMRIVGALTTIWNSVTSSAGVGVWVASWPILASLDGVAAHALTLVVSGLLGVLISISPELLFSAAIDEMARVQEVIRETHRMER